MDFSNKQNSGIQNVGQDCERGPRCAISDQGKDVECKLLNTEYALASRLSIKQNNRLAERLQVASEK